MERRLKRRVAAGAAGLAVVAGGGVAYAATTGGPGKERQAFLDAAAKRLNVSPQKLENALTGAMEDRIDAAVAAGRITKQQGDELKQRIQKGGMPFGPGRGGPPPGPLGMHGHAGPFMGGLDAAAKYLGLTNTELRKQLFSGKSLAEIAKSKSKGVDGLESAIADAVKANLDTAVKSGRITQSQADRILESVKSRLGDVVNGKAPLGPRGPGYWHDRHDGPGPERGQGMMPGFFTPGAGQPPHAA